MTTMAAAFRARPADEPALVALWNAIDTVNEQVMNDAGRQFERHEMLKRTGAGVSSGFVQERIAAAVADMIRERFAGEADVEVRAQLTAGLVSTVMTISTEAWLAKGGTGDVDDEARRCFDILRSLIGS